MSCLAALQIYDVHADLQGTEGPKHLLCNMCKKPGMLLVNLMDRHDLPYIQDILNSTNRDDFDLLPATQDMVSSTAFECCHAFYVNTWRSCKVSSCYRCFNTSPVVMLQAATSSRWSRTSPLLMWLFYWRAKAKTSKSVRPTCCHFCLSRVALYHVACVDYVRQLKAFLCHT